MTPGRTDPRVVDRHLVALRRTPAALRRHAGVSPPALRADSDRRWAVERGLHLCAQNALDVASHVASSAGLDPATYGSSIDCLVEANVLPPDFGERFRSVAGFRNVLVHGYLDVDLDLICRMLAESLDDFEEFARHVERWLAGTAAPAPSDRPFRRQAAPESSARSGQAAPVWAIGVDGCHAGWFYVALEPSGASHFGIAPTLEELVRTTSGPARILVDVPIGLLDGPGGRKCDRAARAVLGPRRSSVFPAPARAVLDAVDYEDAQRRSRTAAGVGLSRQAFAIVPKCREVDALLRADAAARRLVREIHPEVCFWALAGRRPMMHSKKTKEGWKERIAVLNRLRPAAEQEIEELSDRFKRRDVARDDAVDAMAAALTASADDAALRTLPATPQTDSVGLPMEMVYFEPETT